MLRNFLFDECGNSAGEYAMILALIGCAVIGPLFALKEATSASYLETAYAIERAVIVPPPSGVHDLSASEAEEVTR